MRHWFSIGIKTHQSGEGPLCRRGLQCSVLLQAKPKLHWPAGQAVPQLYLPTFFILFLSPPPPGGPGEGPDCQVRKVIVGFGPIPVRIRVGNLLFILIFLA